MLDLQSQDDLSQSDNTFIGIGHSLGLIKLASLNIEFKALIGMQAFTNFLGFDSQLYKKRKLELSAMIKHFRMNPIDTLTSFHKRCGINHNFSSHFNKAKLMRDLQSLTAMHQLPNVPLLILGAVNDSTVPLELIYDNFGRNKVKIVVHNKGHHCLGLYERDFVYEQIANFLNGITQEIHTG